MELVSECVIPCDHPTLAGHFPGRPVVPGVVILDEVMTLAQNINGVTRFDGVDGVKFLRPLLPQQPFTVHIFTEHAGRWRFECRIAGERIAHGSLMVAGEE